MVSPGRDRREGGLEGSGLQQELGSTGWQWLAGCGLILLSHTSHPQLPPGFYAQQALGRCGLNPHGCHHHHLQPCAKQGSLLCPRDRGTALGQVPDRHRGLIQGGHLQDNTRSFLPAPTLQGARSYGRPQPASGSQRPRSKQPTRDGPEGQKRFRERLSDLPKVAWAERLERLLLALGASREAGIRLQAGWHFQQLGVQLGGGGVGWGWGLDY